MKLAFLRSSGIFDDSRSTKELMALLKEGYSIDVFGWDRSGYSIDKVNTVFSQYKDRINFFYFEGLPGRNLLEKILVRFRWSRWLYKNLSIRKPYHLIHSCDYDTGEVAFRFCKKNSIKYIYDIFDYYIDAHPVPRLLRNYIEGREIRVINNSSLTIICTEERREQICKSDPSNLIVIHNSPDLENVPTEEVLYDYIYCGGLNGRRLLSEILALYSQNDDLRFVFGGNGFLLNEIRKMNEEYKNFVFLGSIPYETVLQYEAKSRIISAIYDPSYRNHKLCAPNKFYEALALGKPVIVCRGTGIDEIVKKYNIGLVIDYDAKQFYEAIRTLLSNKNEMIDMGIRAREVYCKNFKWSFMEKRLIQAYRLLVNGCEINE